MKKGEQHRIFKEIFNHRNSKYPLDKADGFQLLPNGQRVPKNSMAGWDLEVKWKDGTTSWLPLKELKETNGVEVTQYAMDNRLLEEPAFAWWAPHYLKKTHRLIKLSKSRCIRKGYKFGIRLPNSIKEALALDRENGNRLWEDVILKEGGGVRIEVKENSKPPPGYKEAKLMMIFV
jgi:hypothetical protein